MENVFEFAQGQVTSEKAADKQCCQHAPISTDLFAASGTVCFSHINSFHVYREYHAF